MTLITRIITKSSVYIASDDQINDRNGYRIGTISKAFKFQRSIGAVAGLLRNDEIKFDILKEINKYDNCQDLVGGILKDIPEELQGEGSIIFLSECAGDVITNYSLLIQNGNIKEVEFVEPFFNSIQMSPIIGDSRLNFFERNNLEATIHECYDSKFYQNHLDFNWSYSNGYNNNRSFIHSLFHVKLFEIYGELALEGLLFEKDADIVGFLMEMYSFIDLLKSENGNVGIETFKGYYQGDNENVLKTIGKCNSIMKIDVESGISVLYQDK